MSDLYQQKLVLAYTPQKKQSGQEWHNYICDAVRLGQMPIMVAHEILATVYPNDPQLTLYCDVASLRLYKRLGRVDIIHRLSARTGGTIDQYMLY